MRLRILLPTVMTGFAALLVGWNVHLEPRMILYDTGAPLWPYQMPMLVLALFDAPAVVLARPFEYLFNCYTALSQGTVIVTTTPFVWWWIADRIERGLLRPPYRFPRILALLWLFVSAGCLGVVIQGIAIDIRWWKTYGNNWPEEIAWKRWAFLLHSLPGYVWCAVVITACTIAAFRLLPSQTRQ